MAETIAKSEEESLQELTDGLQGLQNAMSDLRTQVTATGQALRDLLITQDRLRQQSTAQLEEILSMVTKLAQSHLFTAAEMAPILQQSAESGQKHYMETYFWLDSSLPSPSTAVAAAESRTRAAVLGDSPIHNTYHPIAEVEVELQKLAENKIEKVTREQNEGDQEVTEVDKKAEEEFLDEKESVGEHVIQSSEKWLCSQILTKLMKHKHGWIFNKPVDIVALPVDFAVESSCWRDLRNYFYLSRKLEEDRPNLIYSPVKIPPPVRVLPIKPLKPPKPMAKDPNQMSLEEKLQLGIGLQSLPPENNCYFGLVVSLIFVFYWGLDFIILIINMVLLVLSFIINCFSHTGGFVSAKVIRSKTTSIPGGYGFVEFVSNAAAEKILQSFHGALLPNSEQSFRLNWATLVPVRGVKLMVLNLQFSWEVWLLMLMTLQCKSRLNQCTRLLKEQTLSLTEPDAILKVLSLDVMGNYGIRQDVVAVNSLLSAICCEDNQTTMAWEFFEKIKEKIPPDGDTFAILLKDWDKESNLQKSKSTLDAMVVGVGWCPKNRPTYEAVLMTLVRASQAEEAVELLRAMKQNNCLPGTKFFSYTLDFIIKENDVAHAISLWDITVDGGLARNLIVCNAMIGLLCHNNRIDDAFELFDGMIFHGVFPDSLSYNMIFSCLIKNRKVHDAGKFFLEMLKNEFPPTQPNCVAAIAMLFEGDDPAAAFDIWYYMVQNHVKPIDDSANAVLVGLGNLGRLTELKRFAEDMLDQRIRIDEYTMEILRTTFYKQGAIFRDKFDSLRRKWKAL